MYDQCPNNCSDITLFDVKLDTEENAIVYRCWACDWMEVEPDPFHISGWIVSINQALVPIDIIQSLLTNNDIVGFLRPRLKGESFLSNYKSRAWKFTVGDDGYLRGEVDIAYQTYLRQMIVLAVTYIELILKDFFDSFWVAKPSLLIKVLVKEKNSIRDKAMGAVTFEKVLNGEAKEALIKQVFNFMGDDERRRVIKYLAQRAPIKLDRNVLFDKLRSLIIQRNDFIHHTLYNANDENGIVVQQVYDSFKLILNLLYVLEEIAKQNDIPYWKEFEYQFDEFIK